MKDKLDITLRVANTKLALTINPSEEPLLRAVADEVNHVYAAYEERFTENTPQEVLAKVTVLFADRKSTRLNSSHPLLSRMPSSA